MGHTWAVEGIIMFTAIRGITTDLHRGLPSKWLRVALKLTPLGRPKKRTKALREVDLVKAEAVKVMGVERAAA